LVTNPKVVEFERCGFSSLSTIAIIQNMLMRLCLSLSRRPRQEKSGNRREQKPNVMSDAI
jgi:hypothetical protein